VLVSQPVAESSRALKCCPQPSSVTLLVLGFRETGILLPNNQRQHRTSHAPKDVLPLRICANYGAFGSSIPRSCCAASHDTGVPRSH